MSPYGWLKHFIVQSVLSSLKIGYRSLQNHAARTLVVESIWMSISKNVVGFAGILFDCLMYDSDDIYPDIMSKL